MGQACNVHTISLTFSDVTTPGLGVVLSFNMRDERRAAERFRGEGLSSPGISYLAIANVVLSTDLLSWFSEHMKIRGHREINMRYHVLKNISV